MSGDDSSVLDTDLVGSQNSTCLAAAVSLCSPFDCLPLTIWEIIEDFYSRDDKSKFNVKAVGNVSNIVENCTNIIFTIDDGTGKLICERSLTEQFDRFEMEEIREGICVYVDGHLKSFKGGRRLVVSNLWPVTNFDETIFHSNESTDSQIQGYRDYVRSFQNTPIQNVTAGSTSNFSSQDSVPLCGDDVYEPNVQMVLDYLQHPQSCYIDTGFHIDEIEKELKLPANTIMDYIIDFDRYHYKASREARRLGNVTNGSTPTFSSQDSVPLIVDGVHESEVLMVFLYLERPEMLSGIHMNKITKELELPENKIRIAIKYLKDRGIIKHVVKIL